jgi:cysteinyl-tRNA synthetase
MSKSLKNFITVRDLLDQGVKGVVIRYLLLSTHYRKPFDFNQKALDDAKKSIEKFYTIIASFEKGGGGEAVGGFNNTDPNSNFKSISPKSPVIASAMPPSFSKRAVLAEILENLADDLNVSKVIANLHEMAKEIKNTDDERLKEKFITALDFLGLLDVNYFINQAKSEEFDESFINSQIALRLKFKTEKNFQKADEIRQNLLSQGVILEDISKDKTIWKKG